MMLLDSELVIIFSIICSRKPDGNSHFCCFAMASISSITAVMSDRTPVFSKSSA